MRAFTCFSEEIPLTVSRCSLATVSHCLFFYSSQSPPFLLFSLINTQAPLRARSEKLSVLFSLPPTLILNSTLSVPTDPFIWICFHGLFLSHKSLPPLLLTWKSSSLPFFFSCIISNLFFPLNSLGNSTPCPKSTPTILLCSFSSRQFFPPSTMKCTGWFSLSLLRARPDPFLSLSAYFLTCAS